MATAQARSSDSTNDGQEKRRNGAHLERPDKHEREQYSISDLTTEFECTARALRFYEDEGLISPSRVGLTRVYSKRDRARLAWIMRAKNVGFSLTEIRENRLAGSEYASTEQCLQELASVEALFRREAIPYINTTSLSVEEISTRVLERAGLKRRVF